MMTRLSALFLIANLGVFTEARSVTSAWGVLSIPRGGSSDYGAACENVKAGIIEKAASAVSV